MNGTKYESPRFDFQELKLMERVADTCWGYHYGWFDPDGDGPLPQEKVDLASFGSCNSVETGLVGYVNQIYEQNGIEKTITGSDVKTNSKSTVVVPITS